MYEAFVTRLASVSLLSMDKEYLLFCDESDRKGKFYSNFYGGLIVGASQYERLTQRLNEEKQSLYLLGEVKWEKVTERYLDKYRQLMKCFFQEIAAGHVRVRIMFRQNARIARGLTRAQIEDEYFRLYYQFIKHTFGLMYLPAQESITRLRLYFDQFPDTSEKAARFTGYLSALQENRQFQRARIVIQSQDITQVRSHDHVLLQCLDIVLGAIAFRLNDKHKEKLPNKRIRGKRTRAKELLYKKILDEITQIRPGFNIGITTGSSKSERWSAPYLHWSFEPKDSEYEPTLRVH